MERTPAQEREYQKLTSRGKLNYDCEARENPSSSHDDCMMVALATQSVKDMINEGGKNINPTEPIFKKKLLEKLNDLIHNEFPRIWEKVKDSFRAAISYLDDLISRGVDWVCDNIVDPVIDFLDDIFG